MSTMETMAEFARRLKVSRQAVETMVKAGRIVLTDEKRPRVKVQESLALLNETGGVRYPQDRGAVLPDVRAEKARSEARILAAKADQEEMNRDKQAGLLIEREDVDFVLNDYGAALRGMLENLPDRLAPVVYPLKTLEETHAALAQACAALLEELTETMRRRAAEVLTK